MSMIKMTNSVRAIFWVTICILFFGSQNSLSAKEYTNKGDKIDIAHNSTARSVDFKFSNHDYDTESQHRHLTHSKRGTKASSNRRMTWGRVLHDGKYGYD